MCRVERPSYDRWMRGEVEVGRPEATSASHQIPLARHVHAASHRNMGVEKTIGWTRWRDAGKEQDGVQSTSSEATARRQCGPAVLAISRGPRELLLCPMAPWPASFKYASSSPLPLKLPWKALL